MYLELKENAVEYKLNAVKHNFKKARITSPKDAADYARQFYLDDIVIYESSFILLLNQANETVGFAKISQGGVTGTVVDIKLILKYAIDNLASGIIFIHNHPTGNLRPSQNDIRTSNKLKSACELIDVKLIDSITISDEGYYSMADEGII
jgi:DNA repair protein RadC